MSQTNTLKSCQAKTENLCDHQLQSLPLNYSGTLLKLEECKIRVVKNAEMSNKPVSLWTVDDVCEWIKLNDPSNGSFVEAVIEHAISGRVLLRLTAGKLEQMGIDQESHRHSLLQKILGLRIRDDVESLTTIFEDGH